MNSKSPSTHQRLRCFDLQARQQVTPVDQTRHPAKRPLRYSRALQIVHPEARKKLHATQALQRTTAKKHLQSALAQFRNALLCSPSTLQLRRRRDNGCRCPSVGSRFAWTALQRPGLKHWPQPSKQNLHRQRLWARHRRGCQCSRALCSTNRFCAASGGACGLAWRHRGSTLWACAAPVAMGAPRWR